MLRSMSKRKLITIDPMIQIDPMIKIGLVVKDFGFEGTALYP